MTRKSKLLVLRLLFPLLLLGYMIADAEYALRQSEPWILKIKGYDPRDLFRGHYVRFLIEWNWSEDAGSCTQSSDCCVCLHADGQNRSNPRAEKMNCSLTDRCDAAIRGTSHPNRFDIGLERYYVSEQDGGALQKYIVEGDGAISIVVNQNKNALPKDLLIDGQPWR